jgi:hypothetical protein
MRWVAYIQATLDGDKALVGKPFRNLIVWPAMYGKVLPGAATARYG